MDVAEIFLLDHYSLSWFKEHINTTKHNERQKELFCIRLSRKHNHHIVSNVPYKRKESVKLFVINR